MRKLDYFVAFPIDDSDETGTYGYNRFFCIHWTPGCVKSRKGCLVEPDCKNLRKFFDAKRSNRHCEASKKSLCILSFLLIDTQQCAAVCFVQCLWQVIKDPPNTRRKRATQTVNLADNPSEPTRSCDM